MVPDLRKNHTLYLYSQYMGVPPPLGLCCNLHVVSPDYVFYSTYKSVSKSLGQQIAWIKPTLGNEDPTA